MLADTIVLPVSRIRSEFDSDFCVPPLGTATAAEVTAGTGVAVVFFVMAFWGNLLSEAPTPAASPDRKRAR